MSSSPPSDINATIVPTDASPEFPPLPSQQGEKAKLTEEVVSSQWLEGLPIIGAPRMASEVELVRAFMQVTKPPYPSETIPRTDILAAVCDGLQKDGLETPELAELDATISKRVLGWSINSDWTAPETEPLLGVEGQSSTFGEHEEDITFGGPERDLTRQDDDPFGRRASAGLISVNIESWELCAGRSVKDGALPNLEVDGEFHLPPPTDAELSAKLLHHVGGNTDTLYFYRPSRWSPQQKKIIAPDMLFNARTISTATASTFVGLGWLTPETFALMSPHFNDGGLQNIGPMQAICFGDSTGDLVGKEARTMNNLEEWCPQVERQAAFDWARAQFRMASARKRLTVKLGVALTSNIIAMLSFFSHHVARTHPYQMVGVSAVHKLCSSLLSAVHAKKSEDIIEQLTRTYQGYCMAYALSFDRSKHDIQTWKAHSKKSRDWLFGEASDIVMGHIISERLEGAPATPDMIPKSSFGFNAKRFVNQSWLAGLSAPLMTPFSETGAQASARKAKEFESKLTSEAIAATKPVALSPEDIMKMASLPARPIITLDKKPAKQPVTASNSKQSKGKGVDPAEKPTAIPVPVPRPDFRPKPDSQGFTKIETQEEKRARRKAEKAAQKAAIKAAQDAKLVDIKLASPEEIAKYIAADDGANLTDVNARPTVFGYVEADHFNEHAGFYQLCSIRIPTAGDCSFHGFKTPEWVSLLAERKINMLNAASSGVPAAYTAPALPNGDSMLSVFIAEQSGKRRKAGKTGISVSTDEPTPSPFDHEFKLTETGAPEATDSAPIVEDMPDGSVAYDSGSESGSLHEVPLNEPPKRGRSRFGLRLPWSLKPVSPPGSVVFDAGGSGSRRSVSVHSEDSDVTVVLPSTPKGDPGATPRPPKTRFGSFFPRERKSGEPGASGKPSSGIWSYPPLSYFSKTENTGPSPVLVEIVEPPKNSAARGFINGVFGIVSAPFVGAYTAVNDGFMRFGSDRASDDPDIIKHVFFRLPETIKAPVSGMPWYKQPFVKVKRSFDQVGFTEMATNFVTLSTMFLTMSVTNITHAWQTGTARPSADDMVDGAPSATHAFFKPVFAGVKIAIFVATTLPATLFGVGIATVVTGGSLVAALIRPFFVAA